MFGVRSSIYLANMLVVGPFRNWTLALARCMHSNLVTYQPFEYIPNANHFIPYIGSILKLMATGGATKLHLYCDRNFNRYGPIYRESIGNVDAIYIKDTFMMQQVFAQEDSTPGHFLPDAWLLYNQTFDVQRGLLFLEGDAWKQLRMAMNPLFLGKQQLNPSIIRLLNDVSKDATTRFYQQTGCDQVLSYSELERLLDLYSVETMGTFLFGQRLGCLPNQTEIKPDAQVHLFQKFQQTVKQIFVQTAKMQFIPAQLAKTFNLQVWQHFVSATSQAFLLANKIIALKINTCSQNSPIGMMKNDSRIKSNQIPGIVVDFFLASADTTSQLLLWTVYLLAKNSEYQNLILEEINSLPQELTMECLQSLHLTKAVMKETLRLYPTSPFLSRKYSKRVIVGGYEIPKNKMIVMSLYSAGRSSELYNQPEVFRPQRWLKSSNEIKKHGNFFIPFATGSRSCIGRRIAEAQTLLFLCNFVKKYEFKLLDDKPIDIDLILIPKPNAPFQLELRLRN